MPETRPRPGIGVAGMYDDSMASEMPCVDAMWTPTKPAPKNMPAGGSNHAYSRNAVLDGIQCMPDSPRQTLSWYTVK